MKIITTERLLNTYGLLLVAFPPNQEHLQPFDAHILQVSLDALFRGLITVPLSHGELGLLNPGFGFRIEGKEVVSIIGVRVHSAMKLVRAIRLHFALTATHPLKNVDN